LQCVGTGRDLSVHDGENGKMGKWENGEIGKKVEKQYEK